MEITYENINKVNSTIKTTNIKGKEYAEVNQRIKAFRMLYPEGAIETEVLSIDNGVCIIKAIIKNGTGKILGTGTAYEKEDSSFINKTSYIENCETSAVGRALGMVGLGIDTSVASAEEVQNAIENQNKTEKIENVLNKKFSNGKYAGKTFLEVCSENMQYIDWLIEKDNKLAKQAKEEYEKSQITISDEELEKIS